MLNTQSLTDQIPEPEEVRRRLAENLREARLLRQMLRLSEARRRAVTPPQPASGRGAKP